MDWHSLILTFQLAAITTIILLIIAVPLAFWLSTTSSKVKAVVETIVSMPLVLPPTVIGFYLLVAFSPAGTFGSWLKDTFDIQLVFSFPGLVIASIIYSLPFMVHPIQAGLSNLPSNLSQASYVLGKSKWQTLRYILMPNIKPALLSGIVLAFAHTIGEFGVVLMIGGNTTQTKVASIAIYNKVESMDYAGANQMSLILFAISFAILLTVYLVNGRTSKLRRG